MIIIENFIIEKNQTQKYQKEINLVLKNYPELENTTIFFVERKISYTMNSRPKLNFLFLKKENREYRITFNKGEEISKGILVKNLNSTQRIGILSHEVGHIVDYQNRSKIGIITFGIRYLFPNFKKELEHSIDEIAINHGFGKELIAFTQLAFYGDNVPGPYRKKKHKYYYSPDELQELQNKYEEKINKK